MDGNCSLNDQQDVGSVSQGQILTAKWNYNLMLKNVPTLHVTNLSPDTAKLLEHLPEVHMVHPPQALWGPVEAPAELTLLMRPPAVQLIVREKVCRPWSQEISCG